MALLRAEGVSVRFGAVAALEDVRVEVNSGELVGLIGPNGAGKSVLLDCLCGLVRPVTGRVLLDDQDVTGAPAFWRVWHGLARTFQDARDFHSMRVKDAVAAGACVRGGGFVSDALSLPWAAVARDRSLREARRALELVGAEPLWERRTSDLDAPERRLVQIARALASRPRALLLDEPLAALDADEVAVAHLLLRLRDELGIGILLVEHDPALVFSLCDFIYALDSGRVVAAGLPADVREHPLVRGGYLGVA
jgi:ABC-type branched-subunit amino acid transport system ATPase component